MQQEINPGAGVVEQAKHAAGLDLVVPFTTPELTRVAIDAATRMGRNLNATLRIIRVQQVPYPLDLAHSPIPVEFLKEQLAQFESELPVTREIRFAREVDCGLESALGSGSVVVLGMRRRPWKTRNQRLAESLRRAGHKVMLVSRQEGEKCSM